MYQFSIPTYVIHYSKLKEREKSINKLVDYKFIELRSVITENDIQRVEFVLDENKLSQQVRCISDLLSLNYISTTSQNKEFDFLSYRNVLQNGNLENSHIHKLKQLNFNTKSTDDQWCSIALNSFSSKNLELSKQHLLAIEKGIKQNSDYILILEDDSVLNESVNYLEAISESIALARSQKLVNKPCFIDLSQSLNIHSGKNEIIWESYPGFTQCCSAYILNSFAMKLIFKYSSIYKPLLPIDWHLSYIMRITNIQCYSVNSKIFLQGSSEGLLTSNSSSRNI